MPSITRASMADTELRSFGTKRNDTLWEGDVFELFFKPSAVKPEYFEFQANPRMLVFEMAFPRRGDNPLAFKTAPPLGSKAVVVLKGTLDQPGDRDLGWSVEGRIPWSAFAAGGGKPNPGDEWLFALCRYDYGPDGTRPVLMSSAPLTEPKFHRYEDYGKLRFEGPADPVDRPAAGECPRSACVQRPVVQSAAATARDGCPVGRIAPASE